MRNCLSDQCLMMFRVNRTALASAEKNEEWSGSLFTRTFPFVTAAADTSLHSLDPSVNIF